MNNIFIVNIFAIVLFLISSIVFWFGWRKKEFNSAFIVSAITTVSYTLMLQLGTAPYIRWIGYAVSCALLAWVMAQYLGINKDNTRTILFVTPFVMLTGALASLSQGIVMIVWFVIGSLFYAVMVQKLITGNKELFKRVRPYIIFGWSVFPIIFLLSPEGFGIIPLTYAMIGYIILDIYTKIIFYKTIQEKNQD